MLLRDNVYENLRTDILTCRLAPGDDMREQELAERYAVSRQPVREALLRLAREHLVTVQPRQGYRVNPISLSDARDLLRQMFASPYLSMRMWVGSTHHRATILKHLHIADAPLRPLPSCCHLWTSRAAWAQTATPDSENGRYARFREVCGR